jgi:N-methylhydantoinase A
MMEAASASWRIGVDVGGTFTDLVLVGPDRGVRVFKVPSVPADPSQGVLNALQRAADSEDLPVGRLLASCSLFVHGSTVATNTVLEGKGARVAMLTTAGFRDSLDIRRGARDDPWDHRTPYPPSSFRASCGFRCAVGSTGRARKANLCLTRISARR